MKIIQIYALHWQNVFSSSKEGDWSSKTKYVVMSWNQQTVKNHNIKTGSTSSERVEHLRYLRTNLIDNRQNIIWVIKSRRMRSVGYVACIQDRRCDGKRPLGRPRRI